MTSKNLEQRYLPEQADLDKILKILQRKVLKGTQLPVTLMEIKGRIFEQSILQGCLLLFCIKEIVIIQNHNRKS